MKPGKAIGITGGIGCGKSAVADILRRIGVPVMDADDLAHAALAPGHPVYDRVVDRFGAGILGADREILRSRLAEIVFASERERQDLNELVHPAVLGALRDWLASEQPRHPAVAAVVPLLYEIDLVEPWDAVICVTAREDVATARLRARGYTQEQIDLRRAAQWPVAEKARRADFRIENDRTLEQLEEETRRVWKDAVEKEQHHG